MPHIFDYSLGFNLGGIAQGIGGIAEGIASAEQARLSAEATADALKLKAKGLRVEGQNYALAAALAWQQVRFTAESTEAQQRAARRALAIGLGETRADIGAAGFAKGGSGGDILRSSVLQGGQQQQMIAQQGLISEQVFRTQAETYTNLNKFAFEAAAAQDEAARKAIRAGEIGATAGRIKAGLGAVGVLGSVLSFFLPG